MTDWETPPPSEYRPFPNKAGEPPQSDYIEDDLKGPVYGTSNLAALEEENGEVYR